MDITLSVIKADVGSIGGHVAPSKQLLEAVRGHVAEGMGGLLTDFHVTATGDDIAILMAHTRGVGDAEVHRLAWDAFQAGTRTAREQGLYGAGQDLLIDSFTGNVKGLTRLSKILVRQQDALREVLEAAPVALTNLDRSYNPTSGTLDTRNNFAQLENPDRYLCSLLIELGHPRELCGLLTGVLDQLPDLPSLPVAGAAPSPTRDLTLGGILGEPR